MAYRNLIMAVQNGEQPQDKVYSRNLYDPESGLSFEDPAPNLFSFNSPYGACKQCNGLCYTYYVNRRLVIQNTEHSIREVAICFLGELRAYLFYKLLWSV